MRFFWLFQLSMIVVAGSAVEQPGVPEMKRRIELIEDLRYADSDDPAQQLDLMLPKERISDKPLPLIVFIHGGAWKQGDKKSGLSNLAPLVASGRYAGASIEYRLSGQSKWPAQIHDCKAAIRWLKANANQHNFDSDRMAVWGNSAGGHLVAMLGTTADVRELEGQIGSHLDQSSRVTAVIDFFGPTDLSSMNEGGSTMNHNSADSPESELLGDHIVKIPNLARDASPITYVTSDDAPILIMHGSKDPLVPYRQSQIFHDKLISVGVDSTLVTVQDAGHGFGGPEVRDRVDKFLRRHLFDESVEVSSDVITLP